MEQSQQPPTANQGARADPYNLEQYHDRIQQLYIQESQTLSQVMAVLKKDGCLATKNMYLKKLRIWGFEKNKKHHSVSKAFPTGHVYQKNSTIQHSNDKADGTKMQQYKKGQYDLPYESIAFEMNAPWRLYPQALLSQPTVFQKMQRHLECTANTQMWLQTYSLPIYMDPNNRADSDALDEHGTIVMSEMVHGALLLKDGQTVTAGVRLERAFRSIAPLIRHGSPEMLSVFFPLFHKLYDYKSFELLDMLARYLHKSAAIILGKNHLVSEFMETLIESHKSLDTMVRSAQVAYDSARNILGKSHNVTFSQQMVLIVALRDSNHDGEQIYPLCEDLIRNAEAESLPHIVMDAQRTYADILAKNGQLSRALAILSPIASAISDEPNVQNIPSIVMACIEYASLLMDFESDELVDESLYMERYTTAENFLRTAVKRSNLCFGAKHSVTMNVVQGLGRFYAHYDDSKTAHDQAQSQFDYITELLEDFKL